MHFHGKNLLSAKLLLRIYCITASRRLGSVAPNAPFLEPNEAMPDGL
jgi:hypothetical protein